jgi:hypothetical protein
VLLLYRSPRLLFALSSLPFCVIYYRPDDAADLFPSFAAPPHRPPCPTRGRNREFDDYFDRLYCDLNEDEVDIEEMRRCVGYGSAWA